MSAGSGGFIAIQGTANAKTWPVENVIRAGSGEQGVKKRIGNKRSNGNRREKGNRGRLPPVVSSLFLVKAAHLKRWYQRHGAGSKGQGADGATAPRYPRKGSASRGDT